MAEKDDKGDDRRRFFRINDHVALRVREIPSEELETELRRMHLGLPDRIGLASTFSSTTQQMRHMLDKFRRDQPDLASYLEELNGKLDLLIQLLAVHENEMPDKPTHHVQLSASGIAYRTEDAPPMGAVVELMLLLFPSFTCLRLFGTVVNVGPASGSGEGATLVGVDFTHIRESDRELIIRHVVQRQSVLLREARIALDSGA